MGIRSTVYMESNRSHQELEGIRDNLKSSVVKMGYPSRIETGLINPRPGGRGGGLFLPNYIFPAFSIYLQNGCTKRHQTFSTLPGEFTHWPKIFPKALIGWSQMTSAWRHVLPFSTQRKVSREELSGLELWRYRKTLGQKMCRIIRNTKLLSLAISNFLNFGP